MKKTTKEKMKRIKNQFLRCFAVYAVLPILCGAILGLIFTLHSVGAEEIETFMEVYGEQSLFVVTGATTQKEEPHTGFYFLSADLPHYLKTSAKTIFSTLRKKDEQAPATPETPALPAVPGTVYDSLPEGAVAVIPVDLSSPSYTINTTKYTIDIPAARSAAFPSRTKSENGEPLVLVLHTHATECYLEDDTNLSDFAPNGVETYFLPDKTSFRTTDPEKSVVAVGKVFADTLNSLGVPTLHCTVQHDAEDFNAAYTNAAATIQQYLNEYPSIEYVIDLHRDSITRGEDYVKTSTEIGGEPSAQVMLVVGTNQLGKHPNWETNLIVDTAFKDAMDAKFPGLSRSLYMRTARFNQEYRYGSMLLEVGSSVNTLEEAKTAARAAAESFAAMLQSR